MKTWLGFARIGHGPLFRSIAGGKKVGSDRLTDKHVARLVKRTALAAGIRTDLTEAEREEKFSGHSLRAGLATPRPPTKVRCKSSLATPARK